MKVELKKEEAALIKFCLESHIENNKTVIGDLMETKSLRGSWTSDEEKDYLWTVRQNLVLRNIILKMEAAK